MPVRRIESKQNARLKLLRRALSAPGRGESGEAGRELAGIEGPNIIAEALRSGIKLDTVFVAQGSERLLDSLPLPPETEILLLPGDLLLPALTTETRRPSLPSLSRQTGLGRICSEHTASILLWLSFSPASRIRATWAPSSDPLRPSARPASSACLARCMRGIPRLSAPPPAASSACRWCPPLRMTASCSSARQASVYGPPPCATHSQPITLTCPTRQHSSSATKETACLRSWQTSVMEPSPYLIPDLLKASTPR